jgi:hypothetical protein
MPTDLEIHQAGYHRAVTRRDRALKLVMGRYANLKRAEALFSVPADYAGMAEQLDGAVDTLVRAQAGYYETWNDFVAVRRYETP